MLKFQPVNYANKSNCKLSNEVGTGNKSIKIPFHYITIIVAVVTVVVIVVVVVFVVVVVVVVMVVIVIQ